MPEWICLKCEHKWVDDSKTEPRVCPSCGCPNIYVPKTGKIPKYRAKKRK